MERKNENKKGVSAMETLIKIVKLIDGYELHYRTDKGIKIEFFPKRTKKVGK